MSRFEDSEIIDLIDEVGQYIEFGTREKISPGDREKAIPPTYEFINRRRVKGYVVSKDTSVPLANGETRFGLIQVYILGSEIKMSEFSGNSLILYEGKSYQIEYQQDIRSQGKLVLHKLMLIPAQDYRTINSQDGVVREPEPAAVLYVPIVGSPEALPLPAAPTLPLPIPVPFAPE